jgi:hypothetical protein
MEPLDSQRRLVDQASVVERYPIDALYRWADRRRDAVTSDDMAAIINVHEPVADGTSLQPSHRLLESHAIQLTAEPRLVEVLTKQCRAVDLARWLHVMQPPADITAYRAIGRCALRGLIVHRHGDHTAAYAVLARHGLMPEYSPVLDLDAQGRLALLCCSMPSVLRLFFEGPDARYKDAYYRDITPTNCLHAWLAELLPDASDALALRELGDNRLCRRMLADIMCRERAVFPVFYDTPDYGLHGDADGHPIGLAA